MNKYKELYEQLWKLREEYRKEWEKTIPQLDDKMEEEAWARYNAIEHALYTIHDIENR